MRDMSGEAIANPPLLRYLQERGVSLKDLVETALELFVPHPGVEDREKATRTVLDEFKEALRDVNISTLVGPIANDTVGRLIAGCSSKVYSQATRQSAS
jgi:hypothetical protein